ncbi:Prolyl tripeptidyl peptidase precursor [Anatilimnocola aggregata]|uniref:Prolyl tripeptidyl peptidase n=1 Tax=Anatilimnocola aggregata TaxID=2528021 RepID=A0A517YAL1_9BACT|nr:S9 family peptidase [Anatilimnocola aggregata]QDU27192.1 Prolyl tripeptidyl peptidase precursor [Anatilimnocola aggregata]
MRPICHLAFFLAVTHSLLILAAEPTRLVPEDIYKLAGPQLTVASPKTGAAAVIYRRVDQTSKQERFALGWSDSEGYRLLEKDEPDARNVAVSPDGKWLAVRSTRLRPQGWKQIPATPLQSDVATDIWLVSTDGKQAIPLAGPEKPYGRVFNDPFYGRVAFSPDGKRLVFVADDGVDPRTKEEIEADVYVDRPDQGEGYTGYGTARIWVAELKEEPGDFAASNFLKVTNDDVWYGDPQWTPDSKWLVVHANKTNDVEAVRFSINKNYDIFLIEVATTRQHQLTFGPGPEVSPRLHPDGEHLICLSSPRKGPHADVFNLQWVDFTVAGFGKPSAVNLFDHHAELTVEPPHSIPTFPLPDPCWDGESAVIYSTLVGVENKTIRVEIESAKGIELNVGEDYSNNELSPAVRQVTLSKKYSPPSNPILKERFIAVDHVLRWKNEGLELEGVLTLPPREIAKRPYPLVLYPHGGPHSRSSKGFGATAHVLAHAGYAVFQPNFRGSTGYGKKFLDADRNDLGGGDMRDILAGIEHLKQEKLIDPDRQFVFGSSYGGFMTTWLIGHTRQFRAAVAQNAVTDMNVMWGLSDIQSWTQYELSGLPWEVPERMHERSPYSHVQKVTTPTLLVHSHDDRRVPLPMSRMYHQALLARGVPTQLVIYPDEGHGIRQPKHQVDVLRRTLAWFATHDNRPAAHSSGR